MDYESYQRSDCNVLGEHMENYNVEKSALHRKLQSKVEALRILRQELEKFRTERDQFKLMAETLQLRYSAIKRASELSGCSKSSVANLLHETRGRNIKLTTEVEALKQKLAELQGDLEVLRGTEERHSREIQKENESKEKALLQLKQEKATLINTLENLKKKNAQLVADLKCSLDEKEELVQERDAYKCKAHRLSHELLIALKANETNSKFLDIDGIILENKFLYERLKNLENELEITKNSTTKYKGMLEAKRKKGIIKLGTNTDEDNLLSHKQVKSILESGQDGIPNKMETIQDLRSLCLALLDNLNDKNLALTHQKQTNKILATKISELERRIQMIMGLDSDSTCINSYSPSEILLYGYCPPSRDANELGKASNSGSNADSPQQNWGERFSPEGEDKLSGDSEDIYSVTSDSAHSIISSEYGAENGLSIDMLESNDDGHSAQSSLRMDSDFKALTPKEITERRKEEFKDLPPEIAAMIEKALSELDLNTIDVAGEPSGTLPGGETTSQTSCVDSETEITAEE